MKLQFACTWQLHIKFFNRTIKKKKKKQNYNISGICPFFKMTITMEYLPRNGF